ncbi:MAG: M23 family metallopeptidase [Candidatus Eisenbacteria bacterium]|nr:M23 family metallopeptidase [Candidatus Eisenbacteria bacterium]
MADNRRRRTLLVLVEPDGAARTHQFRISYRALQIAGVAVVMSVLLVVGLVLLLARTYPAYLDSGQLTVENDSLRVAFGRMSYIDAELRELRATNRQLLELVGVEPQVIDSLTKYDPVLDKVPASWQLSQPNLSPYQGLVSRGFRGGAEGARHPGIDVAGPEGSLVVASGGGVVSSAGWDDVYGNFVLLDHGDDIQSFYGHNRDLLVAAGDSVVVGQPIGRLGSTGESSAPHLHFEIRVAGEPVDPGEFVKEYQLQSPERTH